MGVLQEILEECKDNLIVSDMFTKADSVINRSGYTNIVASISGGSDSDIVLDVCERIKNPNTKISYVWFDTGVEYQATKDHLKYLENRYQINIQRERAIKPIPLAVKEYGQPFLSKQVSEYIGRLQDVGFKWEDEPLEVLEQKYSNVRSALRWWCNDWNRNLPKNEWGGDGRSRFNIEFNRYLKEFIMENPPAFKVSADCCEWAKKKVAKQYAKQYHPDLEIIGVRKAEGGRRVSAYKNCYSIDNTKHLATYRPLFWMKQADKEYYERKFNIVHSDCYKKYGMLRTGCVCCPFGGKHLWSELVVTAQNEPLLHKAATTMFKESYEYTKQYREYALKKKQFEHGINRLF